MIEIIKYSPINLNTSKIHHTNRISYKPQTDKISFGSSKHISIIGKNFKDKIRIVFSDVDGTLSPHSDIVSPKTISAVEFLHKKNIPVILTTSRCYKDTLPVLEQFSHTPDYTIVLQGGGIIDKNGKAIIDSQISQKNGQHLVNWSKSITDNDKNTHLIMYFDDEPYAITDIQYPWKARSLITQVKSFDELFERGQKLQKAVLYKADAETVKFNPNTILSSFKNSDINELAMKTSGSGCFEVQNSWVTKDKAIEYLLKKLGLEPKTAMAIGDSSNDLEMLDYISSRNGLAIAMGDANKEVKTHANAITSGVYDDGFAVAIDNLFSK